MQIPFRRQLWFIVRKFRKGKKILRRKLWFIVRKFRKGKKILRRKLWFIVRKFRKGKKILRRKYTKLTHAIYLLINFHVFSKESMNYRIAYDMHSMTTRNLIANQASFGKYDAEELFRKINDSLANVSTKSPTISLKPLLLLELARLVGTQPTSTDDKLNALNAYRFILKNSGGWNRMPRIRGSVTHDFAYLNLCVSADETTEWEMFAKTLIGSQPTHDLVKIDLNHVAITKDRFELNSWLHEFNKLFSAFKLEGISINSHIDQNQLISLDNIESMPTYFISDGPLVTIIVSALNPGIELITSLNSLVNQSWKNLEIIVVDDCSSETQFIDKARSLDPRIRVIRQEPNQGTYAARNLAMSLSSGEFITFQDSDDWAHPRRVEKQILPLLSDKDLVATYAKAIRISKDLLFTREAQFPLRENNASSLFFRYSAYLDLGDFDPVRKAADSEYAKRINAYYKNEGQKSNYDPVKLCSNAYLSIIRMGHASLSRNDFQGRWLHPSRSHYWRAYARWHASNLGDKSKLHLNSKNPKRLFPAPIRFAIDDSVILDTTYDVVFALDATQGDLQILRHINYSIERGLKVGIVNLIAHSKSLRFYKPLDDLINEMSVQLLTFDEIVSCDFLVIRTLRSFQYPSPLHWNISSNSALVLTEDNLKKVTGKLKSPNPKFLSRKLLEPNFPVDLSKVRLNSPLDLGIATWYVKGNAISDVTQFANIVHNLKTFDFEKQICEYMVDSESKSIDDLA